MTDRGSRMPGGAVVRVAAVGRHKTGLPRRSIGRPSLRAESKRGTAHQALPSARHVSIWNRYHHYLLEREAGAAAAAVARVCLPGNLQPTHRADGLSYSIIRASLVAGSSCGSRERKAGAVRQRTGR